jgi:hypothetical protein
MASDLVEVDDDGKMTVNYHSGQAMAMDSIATETYVIAGLQSGKTTFLPHWLRREMIRCGPGNRGLVYLAFGPTYAVLGNKGVPEFRRIFEDITGWGRFIGSPKSRIEITKKGEQALWGHEQKETTSIYFCYADDPSSFAGYTALAAVGDEIGQHRFKSSAYDEMKARLTIARGKVAPNNAKVGMPAGLKMGRFCGGSIVYGLNWVYEHRKQWAAAVVAAKNDPDFQERLRIGAIHPVYHFVRFDSTMNPAFPQHEFEIAKATMEEWYFNMRYRGIFSRPAGLIYGAWKPEFERLEADLARAQMWPIPLDWPRAAAFDPGDVNFYGLFGAQQPNDKWLLYDTYSDGGELSFRQRGQVISEREPNLIWSVVGQISEDRWRRELRLGGLQCEAPPIKDFWAGINTSIAAIKLAQIEMVKEKMRDVIDDFGTFSRPVDDRTGHVIMGQKPDDESQRHYMAALRYFSLKAFFGLGTNYGAVAGGGDSGSGSAPPPIDLRNRHQPACESSLRAHVVRGGPIRGARTSGDRFLD